MKLAHTKLKEMNRHSRCYFVLVFDFRINFGVSDNDTLIATTKENRV